MHSSLACGHKKVGLIQCETVRNIYTMCTLANDANTIATEECTENGMIILPMFTTAVETSCFTDMNRIQTERGINTWGQGTKV